MQRYTPAALACVFSNYELVPIPATVQSKA